MGFYVYVLLMCLHKREKKFCCIQCIVIFADSLNAHYCVYICCCIQVADTCIQSIGRPTVYMHSCYIYTLLYTYAILEHSLVLISSQALVPAGPATTLLVRYLPLSVHIQAHLVVCSFVIVIISIYHWDVSYASCIPVLCVVIITSYNNITVCVLS